MDQMLVEAAHAGEIAAIEKLIKRFEPLILKISKTIYWRYNRCRDIQEIIEEAKHLFIYLTIMKYNPCKSRFPHFIKTHLHAELVHVFRPIFQYYKNIQQLVTIPSDTPQIIEQEERASLYTTLFNYVDTAFNERERDIIYEYICGTSPRSQLAQKYCVSTQRIKFIEHKILSKLKQWLYQRGIKKIGDILVL